jgi:hypothetical protein
MPTSSYAEDRADNAALAKKLSNPVADLISVPFQVNYDQGIGPNEDGERLTLDVQPVIPFHINEDWKVISRTIMPFVLQDEIAPGEDSEFGMGDITQSLFFTPGGEGLIWGFGPVFLLPTATDELMGSKKWAAGPTGLILNQVGDKHGDHWTYGIMANHIWSFAGDDDREDISTSFLQPFLSYTTKTAWTFNINTEAGYDWNNNEASVPVNAGISKIVRIGKLPLSLQAGVGYWADSPDNAGPEGFRFRTGVTFILPE